MDDSPRREELESRLIVLEGKVAEVAFKQQTQIAQKCAAEAQAPNSHALKHEALESRLIALEGKIALQQQMQTVDLPRGQNNDESNGGQTSEQKFQLRWSQFRAEMDSRMADLEKRMSELAAQTRGGASSVSPRVTVTRKSLATPAKNTTRGSVIDSPASVTTTRSSASAARSSLISAKSMTPNSNASRNSIMGASRSTATRSSIGSAMTDSNPINGEGNQYDFRLCKLEAKVELLESQVKTIKVREKMRENPIMESSRSDIERFERKEVEPFERKEVESLERKEIDPSMPHRLTRLEDEQRNLDVVMWQL